jgi:hypothetical protein
MSYGNIIIKDNNFNLKKLIIRNVFRNGLLFEYKGEVIFFENYKNTVNIKILDAIVFCSKNAVYHNTENNYIYKIEFEGVLSKQWLSGRFLLLKKENDYFIQYKKNVYFLDKTDIVNEIVESKIITVLYSSNEKIFFSTEKGIAVFMDVINNKTQYFKRKQLLIGNSIQKNNENMIVNSYSTIDNKYYGINFKSDILYIKYIEDSPLILSMNNERYYLYFAKKYILVSKELYTEILDVLSNLYYGDILFYLIEDTIPIVCQKYEYCGKKLVIIIGPNEIDVLYYLNNSIYKNNEKLIELKEGKKDWWHLNIEGEKILLSSSFEIIREPVFEKRLKYQQVKTILGHDSFGREFGTISNWGDPVGTYDVIIDPGESISSVTYYNILNKKMESSQWNLIRDDCEMRYLSAQQIKFQAAQSKAKHQFILLYSGFLNNQSINPIDKITSINLSITYNENHEESSNYILKDNLKYTSSLERGINQKASFFFNSKYVKIKTECGKIFKYKLKPLLSKVAFSDETAINVYGPELKEQN